MTWQDFQYINSAISSVQRFGKLALPQRPPQSECSAVDPELQLLPKKSEIPFHSPNSETPHKSTWIRNLICMVRIAFDWVTCTNHHTNSAEARARLAALFRAMLQATVSLMSGASASLWAIYSNTYHAEASFKCKTDPAPAWKGIKQLLSCAVKARTALQTNAETLNRVWVCLVSSVFTIGKRCAERITFLYRL